MSQSAEYAAYDAAEVAYAVAGADAAYKAADDAAEAAFAAHYAAVVATRAAVDVARVDADAAVAGADAEIARALACADAIYVKAYAAARKTGVHYMSIPVNSKYDAEAPLRMRVAELKAKIETMRELFVHVQQLQRNTRSGHLLEDPNCNCRNCIYDRIDKAALKEIDGCEETI